VAAWQFDPTQHGTSARPDTDADLHASPPDVSGFYEEAFRSSPDGILLVDAHTQRAIVFNDAACRQLGYTREEFAQLRISDYEAREAPSDVEAHLRQATAAGLAEFDTLHRTRAGELRHVRVWARALDLNGRPAFYTKFRDITEQRRVEDALRHSHVLQARTGQLAEVGGWELDLQTQTLYWDAEVRRIHEVGPTFEPTVSAAIQFYAPEARGVIEAAVEAAVEHAMPFDVELPLTTARGRRIWVRAQGTPERDHDRVTRVYGAFQNITDRRAAGQLERLQRAALHAAADGIVITDRDGTIEWVNPAFTALTGYTFDEALGHNPRDLVKSGRHPADFYRTLWETVSSGRTWHGEIVNRRKDGAFYTEEQTITPIFDPGGEITHYVAIKKDITARMKLEAELRQSQKMDTVGQLASGIAHDFNNLLTVINGVSDLMVADLPDGSPMRDDAREIRRAGERAADLTHQLLAFSRRQLLQPHVIDLNAAVESSELLLRRLLGEDIQLVVDRAPDLGRVKADPGQIEQVIVNLAVNARDAMPQGGHLTIRTYNMRLEEPYAGQGGVTVPVGAYVQLEVTDSGVGMDEATRQRAFEPFFTTKPRGKGTGLGLSTVYGIVKQSQGYVWVYSEPDRGSTFRILLPMVSDEVTVARPRTAAATQSGTETILIVEDNAGLHKLVNRLLASAGYTVLGAPNGAEALRLLQARAQPVHLLLTDVVMPQMSGRQLVERLAAVAPNLKVLYMSGYTDDTIVRHGLLDARAPFLNKPFTRSTLLQKVREALDG
jgi:PAS domain S-box-containing protein